MCKNLVHTVNKNSMFNIHYLTCTCSSYCIDGDYDPYQEQNDFVPPIDQIEERMRKVEDSQAAIEYRVTVPLNIVNEEGIAKPSIHIAIGLH